MMKIMVTGGAGLIGAPLCERLLEQGHYVVCIDNMFNSTMSNLTKCLASFRFEFIEHDICSPFLILAGKFDRIYHLACPASPVHYQHDPVQTMKTSIYGSFNMLELAQKYEARILFTSSSEVYGSIRTPIKETYYGENVDTLGPRACYVESKRAAEALFMSFKRQFNVDIRIARLFNVYGPRMSEDDGRVVPNFILKRPITIYGDGYQERSFCYVDDCVDGLIKLMESNVPTPINIGDPSGNVSIFDLAEEILKIMGDDDEAQIVYEKKRSRDEPNQRCPDISQAQRLLLWTPRIDLIDGLKLTVEYYKQCGILTKSEE